MSVLHDRPDGRCTARASLSAPCFELLVEAASNVCVGSEEVIVTDRGNAVARVLPVSTERVLVRLIAERS